MMNGILFLAVVAVFISTANLVIRLKQNKNFLPIRQEATNWKHEPKAVYRKLYHEGAISRDAYERIASDIDGNWVN